MDVSAQISDVLDPLSLKEWRSPARIAKWTDEEKVEFYLSCGWPVAKIKRETGYKDAALKEIVDRIDEAKIREVSEGDEKARARQISYLEQVAAEAMDAYHEKLDRKGRRDMRPLRIGMLANEHIRKIRGMDAPKKINYDLAPPPAVAAADQQAFVNADPEIRARLTKLKEEQRALMAQIYRPANQAEGVARA